MVKKGTGRLTQQAESSGRFRRPSRAELLLLAIAVPAFLALYSTLNFEAVNLANTGVRDLETTLIQVNGLLLAFSAVLFAQLLSGTVPKGVLSGMPWAFEKKLLERLTSVSQALLLRIVVVFLLFVASLLSSIFVLVSALLSPTSATPIADSVVIPVAPMVVGISYVLVAVGLHLKAERKAIDAVSKPGV